MKKIALIIMSCFLFATISVASQASEKTVKLLKKYIERQNVEKVRRMLDEVTLTKKELDSCFEYADLCFATYLNEAGVSPLIGGLYRAAQVTNVAFSGVFSYLLAKVLPKVIPYFTEKCEPDDNNERAALQVLFGFCGGITWLMVATWCSYEAGSVWSLVKQIANRGKRKKAQMIKQMFLEQKEYSS